jgi:hypothetical protein
MGTESRHNDRLITRNMKVEASTDESGAVLENFSGNFVEAQQIAAQDLTGGVGINPIQPERGDLAVQDLTVPPSGEERGVRAEQQAVSS